MYPVHVPISPLDTLLIPRALTSLNISNNNLGQCDLLPDEWQLMKDTGWEYELKDGKTLPDGNCGQDTPPANSKSSGVIALANAISANGALSIANVMGNHIGEEMRSKLQEIMRSKPNLISLCGIADDATEANLSGRGMDADDAIILASELPGKRAMTSLDLTSNGLGVEGAKIVAAFLPKCT